MPPLSNRQSRRTISRQRPANVLPTAGDVFMIGADPAIEDAAAKDVGGDAAVADGSATAPMAAAMRLVWPDVVLAGSGGGVSNLCFTPVASIPLSPTCFAASATLRDDGEPAPIPDGEGAGE